MMSALPRADPTRDDTLLSYRRVAQFIFYSSLVLYFSVSPWPCPSQALQMDPWSTVCGRTHASPLPRAARCSCGFVSSARTEGEALQLLQGQHLREPSATGPLVALHNSHGPCGHTRGCSCQEGHSLSQHRPVPGLETPAPMSQALPGTHQKPGCRFAEVWVPANTPKCWVVILPAAGSEGDSCCLTWVLFPGTGNTQMSLGHIPSEEGTELVTRLSILVPADGSSRNGVSFTLQGQAVVHFDLHLLGGQPCP